LRIAPLFAAIGAWLPDAAKGEVNKLPEFPWGPE
jgi:hypothetical protein